MTDSSRLTELQLAILRVFWTRGRATVPELFRALWDERGLAQSTVATLITRLEKRGLLAREGDGRQYGYHPPPSGCAGGWCRSAPPCCAAATRRRWCRTWWRAATCARGTWSRCAPCSKPWRTA